MGHETPIGHRARRVLFVQRRLPAYRVAFFDKLRNLAGEENVDLSLVHGSPTKQEQKRGDSGYLSWACTEPITYVGFGPKSLYRLPLTEHMKGTTLVIVPHELAFISLPSLVAARRRRGWKLAFFGHGANFAEARGSVGDRVRALLAVRADWWFGYTELSTRRLVQVGVPAARITCVNNATDTTSILGWRAKLDPSERRRLLAELGLNGRNVAVCLGSLHPRKKLDMLFSVADAVRARLPEFELVVIGDGPCRDLVRRNCDSRPWAYWAGARHGRDMVLWASLGRVLLNPGMVGLTIVDSFALGLPLITARSSGHMPEIAYLRDGVNGVMLPDDVDAFAGGVASLLVDRRAYDHLVSGCEESAREYTVDRMAERFLGGILRATA